MGSSGGWGVEGWAVQLKFVGSGREIPWGWSFNKEVREKDGTEQRKPAQVSSLQKSLLRPMWSPQHIERTKRAVHAFSPGTCPQAVLMRQSALLAKTEAPILTGMRGGGRPNKAKRPRRSPNTGHPHR